MSKVKKGKRVAAAAMAVALSMATVTTGVLPNTTVHVHAEEDGSVYKKIADSSVDGFYYEQNVWGYIQCTTDKTLEYSSYDEMIKKLSEITKKIVQENAYDRYSFSFPIKISSAAKDERFENDQVNKDLENEVYKEETGDPKGGHTMASMGGGLTNIYDITYSESEKAYIGEVTGSGGYGSKKDRYDQTVKKLNEVIKNLNLDGKSDYDKFKAVTNWIVSNVTYDSHYNGKPNIPAGTEYPHDMTGAVLDKYAVCDGYAGLFYYMANAVGLKALYEDGTSISEQKGHAWNLVKMDGVYYYVDPTNAYFKEDGEPGSEVLHGQKYFFTLYAPDSTTIEDTYKNISQDDYLKEHSVCKGNHNLRENGGKSAQCTTPATIHYECTNPGCLYEYDVESSPALGHAWDEGKITQEQSCDNPEITTYTCTRSNCRKKKQVETKPALGHTWDEGKITKEATCSETGVKTYTCSRCGGTKTEEIPKTKHDYEEHVVKAPTCTEKGISYYVCKNCRLTTSRRQTPATGHIHTEVRNQKDATYKEEGYTGDTYCKDCGKKLETGTVIPKLIETEHDYGEWVLDQAPTCKKYGARHRICKNCGETKTESIPKTEHQWDNGKVTKEATCKEEGSKTYTCSICGDTKTEAIPKKEHSFDEGKITKKATCTEDGLKVYTCKSCGETKEEVLKATGHQHTELRNEKKATCTEEGYTGDTYCTDCGELIKKGSATEKADHNWKVTSEEKATCEKDGSKTYTCADCKETKTETIPATGHKFGDWQTVTTQSVFTGGVQKRICNVCGKEETRNVGNQLKATIKTNASSLKLKRKQATKKFVVSGLATGDSVKSWTSSNQKIVKVFGSRNGACTIKAGNKTGKAKITITLVSGLKKTINVTVQKNAVACTSIKNVPKKITLNAKKSYQLKPVINPITCTYKAKYKTSNKKIVKVTSRGKITAVKKGKAKITVMVGKKKFVCTVTIK